MRQFAMADDAAIRRANLVRLLKTPKEANAQLGGEGGLGGYSYWAALMNDAKKPFGEKVARKIEERMNWPRGSLDLPDGVDAAPPEPQQAAAAEPDWRTVALLLARKHPHEKKRIELADFIRRVDEEYADIKNPTGLAGKFTPEAK